MKDLTLQINHDAGDHFQSLPSLNGFGHAAFSREVYQYVQSSGLLQAIPGVGSQELATLMSAVTRWVARILARCQNATCGLLLTLLPRLRNLSIQLYNPPFCVHGLRFDSCFLAEYDAFEQLFATCGYRSSLAVQRFASRVNFTNLETFVTTGKDIDLLSHFTMPNLHTVEVDYEGFVHTFGGVSAYIVYSNHPFGNLDTLKINMPTGSTLHDIGPYLGPDPRFVSIRKVIIAISRPIDHNYLNVPDIYVLADAIKCLQHCLKELEVGFDNTLILHRHDEPNWVQAMSAIRKLHKLRVLSVHRCLLADKDDAQD